MRVKSELWVKAYIRRCAAEGIPAAVVRRGDADAGVVFVKVTRLDGTAELYGPAPAGLARDDGEPRWAALSEAKPEADVELRLGREREMDPDLWIIEVEDRQGRHLLDDWLAKGV